MKKSELKQLIREVIKEVGQQAGEQAGDVKAKDLNIRFNFVVGDQNISYGDMNRRNWFNGAIKTIYYNRERDYLEFQGEYTGEMDNKNVQGQFMFNMKNFLEGGTAAGAQTTGAGILRGFWQNTDIYDFIPDRKDKRGGIDGAIFIPDPGREVLRYLKQKFEKGDNNFKDLERRYVPTL
jgi:hypothetical protein